MTTGQGHLRSENGKVSAIGYGECEDIGHWGGNRQTTKVVDATIASKPNRSFELVCGMRIGLMNSTWPGAWCRLSDEGVAFDCSGFKVQVRWADVKSVAVVRRFHLIGSGVRFRIPALRSEVVLVWLGSRKLVDLLIEGCGVYQVPVIRKRGVFT
jgi:hypothetical protein